ncbi:MAG: DUF3365 domain-containing protein [Acidobacteriota bacterium]
MREFAGNRGVKHEWKGLITRNGKEYFAHFKAISMEQQCAMCHGDPSKAPHSLVQRYGKSHGYFWQVGDFVGLESVTRRFIRFDR